MVSVLQAAVVSMISGVANSVDSGLVRLERSCCSLVAESVYLASIHPILAGDRIAALQVRGLIACLTRMMKRASFRPRPSPTVAMTRHGAPVMEEPLQLRSAVSI